MDTSAASTPAAKTGGLSRRKLPRAAIVAVAAVAVVLGLRYYLHSLAHESTDDATVEGHVVAISPRVPGHIVRVLVDDNQEVHAGDVLVELDPNDYQARLNAAEAAAAAATARVQANSLGVDLTTVNSSSGLDGAVAGVAQAQAAVAQAQAEQDSAKAALARAKADVDAAKARHERDAADLTRARDMAKSKAVSPQQLDHAVAAEGVSAADLSSASHQVQTRTAMLEQSSAARKAAEQALLQARARLTQAKSAPTQVARSKSEAAVAKAEAERTRAELEQARLNLSYATVVAPCDGHVTRKSAEAGAYVQVGQALLSIVQPDPWVVANFKETQLTRMQPGQPVEVSVDTYPGVTFRGHVDSIQRGTGARFSLFPPENATGNYVKVVQRVPVKIVLDHEAATGSYLLAPGMSVEPEVNVSAPGSKAAAQNSATPGAPDSKAGQGRRG